MRRPHAQTPAFTLLYDAQAAPKASREALQGRGQDDFRLPPGDVGSERGSMKVRSGGAGVDRRRTGRAAGVQMRVSEKSRRRISMKRAAAVLVSITAIASGAIADGLSKQYKKWDRAAPKPIS